VRGPARLPYAGTASTAPQTPCWAFGGEGGGEGGVRKETERHVIGGGEGISIGGVTQEDCLAQYKRADYRYGLQWFLRGRTSSLPHLGTTFTTCSNSPQSPAITVQPIQPPHRVHTTPTQLPPISLHVSSWNLQSEPGDHILPAFLVYDLRGSSVDSLDHAKGGRAIKALHLHNIRHQNSGTARHACVAAKRPKTGPTTLVKHGLSRYTCTHPQASSVIQFTA